MRVDSGQLIEHHPQPLWTPAGTKIRVPRTVVVTKGCDDAFRLIANISGTDAARKRNDVRIFTIGTHYAKEEFYSLLRLAPLDNGEFPAGYVHLPAAYDKAYFRGLVSESRVVHADGKVEWVRDRSVRNEPLDLRVMCRAAAELVGLGWIRDEHWNRLEAMCSQKESK